jgi:hypothetical protein
MWLVSQWLVVESKRLSIILTPDMQPSLEGAKKKESAEMFGLRM